MANMVEWQKDINKLDPDKAERLADALLTLGSWDMFEAEFKHMGVPALFFMLDARRKEQCDCVECKARRSCPYRRSK